MEAFMCVILEQEDSPIWNEEKRDLLAAFPGRFTVAVDCDNSRLEQPIGGSWHWYRVLRDGAFCGFAWWGTLSDGRAELEICLRVQGQGVGTEVLRQLELEAAKLGISRFEGVVRAENPDARRVVSWLQSHGFSVHLPGVGWTVEAALRAGQNISVSKDISKPVAGSQQRH